MCKYLPSFLKLKCFYFITLIFSKTKFNEINIIHGKFELHNNFKLIFYSLEIPVMTLKSHRLISFKNF